MALNIIPFEDYYIKETIFLTCVSYEDRSKLALKKILECNKIKKCFVIKLIDLLLDEKENHDVLISLSDEDQKVKKAWQTNYNEIQKLLDEHNVEKIEIEGSSSDPLSLAQHLNTDLPENDRILFDISSFPKHILLEILRWNENKKFVCLYARPGADREAEREFSIGTKNIGVLRGFEGDVRIDRSNLLILILGFEGSRALSIFKHFEPYSVFAFLGNTIPFFSEERNEFFLMNAKKNNSQLLSNQKVMINQISSLDPYVFKKSLKNKISESLKNNEMNVLISCLGTKPQTLGLFLYWLENKNIQIVYSIPTKRRISSEGLGPMWIYKLKELLHE
jgi:hypothetical protein